MIIDAHNHIVLVGNQIVVRRFNEAAHLATGITVAPTQLT